ncbi:MAG TPA: nucleotide disphospho-sugar-binding domain-containing protein [Pseudonocardia sp.]|jgi:UDP:flavonoid glycosyltransferase YjiC (YdhE family)|nr:nucleotide disphospho-sugar-binding domain-containing protein [Pseudonocardia sp.]
MRFLFSVAPGYGLMMPVVPLAWAARAAGHEVLMASASDIVDVGARAGLAVYDVIPDRDVWDELIETVRSGTSGHSNPFALFTLTMTEGTIAAAREFGADVVVYTSDHPAGALAALALGVPAFEVGNRVSWSMRDVDFRDGRDALVDDPTVREVRTRFDIPDGRPKTVARVDIRPPSMGGITSDQSDQRDGVPWWPMRFVPYNGGAPMPAWALGAPPRRRICVTLGTIVPAMSGVGLLESVLTALGGMDVEVVLATGTADLGALGELPPNVRPVGFLPLSSVLPSCDVIVHHGGSGTTASPLHYGVPQLVLPSFADNPLSAKRVADRGVGLSVEPAEATPERVRSALDRLLTEPGFKGAAREVSAEMATQPSPATVLERLVRLLGD